MLKTALMFKDHMILQRDKEIRIWGTALPGETVTLTMQGGSWSCRADADGNWMISACPLRTSFSEEMKITAGEESLVYTDVQIGDVYLASGQSNMEFFMRYDADLKDELAVCANDNIRFFDYPEVSYPEQINEADYGKNFGFWRKASPEDLEWFSAVGYYFAKDIQKRYDIPVGIIGCNWGGTPACAWMSREAVEEAGEAWLREYEEGLKTLDLKAYNEQFPKNPAAWRTAPFEDPFTDMLMRGASILDIIRKLTGQEPDLSAMDPSAFVPVIGPKSELRPCGLYESMLRQVAPYTLRGFLFYQGETDGDNHPELYRTIFPALIRCFRSLWQEELPFLFVQIAPFGSWMQSTGEPYIAIREAQQMVSENVSGTGMAVITDVGMELDIHPKKKQPVGHRLALQAMNRIYGETDVLCEAPTLSGAEIQPGKLILSFVNAGTGLSLADHTPDGAETDPTKPGGLQIFADGQVLDLSQVQATADGSRLILDGPVFKEGMSAEIRLACTGWYRVNLYNSAGIPARPAKIAI